MKNLRRLSGFSLVEMMLLLLITSLMLASGMTIISKKHVKVPKIAMHGAYMCYYKDGQLHEEQYVGPVKALGTNKKIMDRDVTECRFKPPARLSYMYIQATAGGGGGGDSGYKGGNLQKFTSAVDKMSPFGITQDILDLKGFDEGELKANGGKIEAWAHGKDDGGIAKVYGEAGNGGDVYYIKQTCAGSSACIVHRDWEYTGNQERDCKCETGNIRSTKVNYSYEYTCGQSSYSSYTCNRNKYEPYGVFNFKCTEYGDKYEYCNSYSECEDGYTRLSGANDETESCTYDSSDCDHCKKWNNYKPCPTDDNPDKTCYSYHYECESAWRYTGRFDYGRKIVTDRDNCTSCTWDETCDGKCYIETRIPTSASCSKAGKKDLVVKTTDKYAADYDNKPYFGQISGDIGNGVNSSSNNTAYTGKSKKDLELDRKVYRQPKGATYEYTLCNYGNPSLFAGGDGSGTFGSSALGWDGNIASCSSAEILKAFGEGIIPLGGGVVSRSYAPTAQAANDFYNKEIKYLLTEEKGLNTVFGPNKICENLYNGDCEPRKELSNTPSYTNPSSGKVFKNTEPLYTQCSMKGTYNGTTSSSSASSSYTQDGSKNTCSSLSGLRDFTKWRTGTEYPNYNINTKCYCKQKDPKSKGSKCLYKYGDVKNDKQEISCYYSADVVKGGKGGLGKNCAFSSDAGLNLTYKGNSDLIPGIRGSDEVCMNAFKPLYTKAEWQNQSRTCFAQNGTDSQGSATIELDGQTCTVHNKAPKKGKGARRQSGGPTSIPIGSGKVPNFNGTDGDGGNGAALPACAHNGPHVGYCVKGHIDYKYSYTYTWNTNYLQYGEGGKAGGYNVKLIRSVKDGEYAITLGKGGAGGAVGSGASGENGGDTIITFVPAGGEAVDKPILTVLGGAGGPGGLVGSTEQLPRYHQGGTFIQGMNGTLGENASLTGIKTNIMNLVLPQGETNILNQWLLASGAGGDGGGSTNNCWASEWHREFEGVNVVGKWGPAEEEDVACRHGANEDNYYSATPAATSGISGVVVITW